MTKKIVFIVLAFLTLSAFGQNNDTTRHYFKESDRYFSVVTGLNCWRYCYAEVGFAINEDGRNGRTPFAWAYSVSGEFKVDNDLLFAPKLGVSFCSGFSVGLNILYYTDLNNSSVRLRPEFGCGMGRWKVVYGYNIPVTNQNFKGVNDNCVSIVYLIGLKKLKTVRY